MSKIVLIRSIIITIVVVVLPTCTNTLFSSQHQNATAQTSVTTSNFLTYINHIYGIKIQYPADWRLGEHHYTNRFAVDFISTSKNNSDTAPATITLSVETLKQNKTLNGFTTGNLAKARQSLPGFQLIQSNATTLAGTPAHKIIYFFSSADPTIQLPFISMNVWTIKQSKVYSISYTEAKPQYVKYLPITQKMIDSLELIK
jgi:serine/threonine-protein kinase